MLGLALEGGGAKGAFHMGVVKAYLESGYTFDGVAGTSIGAFNGAIIAQGDFELGYKIWENMETSLIFDIEDTQVKKILSKTLDKDAIMYLTSKVKELIDNKGLDTSRIRKMLDDNINEDKLRQSTTDFAMVTVSVTDLKPLELYKEDVPPGMMSSYIMASANFPAFKLEPIEGKFYVDGGFYDNCPINLLIRKGYREIVAVRTLGIGLTRKIEDDSVKITSIYPSEDLGRILNFDNNLIQRNLKMGYYDALKVIRGLCGRKYYIEALPESLFVSSLMSLPDEGILRIGHMVDVPVMEPKRMLFEKIIPVLAELLDLPATASYQDILLGTLEYVAEESGIDRFRIYKYNEFYEAVTKQNIKAKEPINPVLSTIAKKTKFLSGFSKDIVLREALAEFIHMSNLESGNL